MPQKKNNSNNSEKPQNAYFLSLELENVRCFGERQKIDFSDGIGKPRQWTIILGDNGTGKTTILQNLIASLPISFSLNKNQKTPNSLAPMFPIIDARYPNWFLKKSSSVEFINIEASFLYTSGLQIESSNNEKNIFTGFQIKPNGQNSLKLSNYIKGIEKIAYFAYGASRKSGKTSLSDENDEPTYATLFDEKAILINPEEWLLQADYIALYKYGGKRKKIDARSLKSYGKAKTQVARICEILVEILPDAKNIKFGSIKRSRFFEYPAVNFHTHYGWVEAKDLSLGYRTSMAWMVDFASRMFDLYPDSENPLAEPAVVLIDEIDLHLHPKWQRELIDYLSNLFPNTQFIVTTHSPLIVQAAAARDANFTVCRREGDHVVIDQSVEAVRGWRADQILTSDLFDLPSTRDTELEKLEKQRREILSKPKLTKADERKLKTLSTELDALPVNEEPEDDKAMDIIRRAAQYLEKEKV